MSRRGNRIALLHSKYRLQNSVIALDLFVNSSVVSSMKIKYDVIVILLIMLIAFNHNATFMQNNSN